MLLLLRLFTFAAFSIFVGVGVHDLTEEKYKKGLVMFGTAIGFLINYASKRIPSNSHRTLLPVLLAAVLVGGVDWSDASQLPASPFTLETPVTAPPTTPCSKKCKCGCQEGGECDCEEFSCAPDCDCGALPGERCRTKVRAYLERPYNFLPDDKTCQRQLDQINSRLALLCSHRAAVDQLLEMYRPWNKGYQALSWERDFVAKSYEYESHLSEVWYACSWATWRRDKASFVTMGYLPREEWAKKLRLLIGDQAFYSGNLPR